MFNPTLAQYLLTADDLISEHYSGHTVRSALQRALWFNSVALADQTDLTVPQAYTSEWSGLDNQQRYGAHLADPAHRAQLAANGWLNTDIDYTVNSWGFRSHSEYDHVPEQCIVTLGCSFTFGTGLHQHQTWPSILAERLGVRLVNLGTPGHGLDLNTFWLLTESEGILNPLAVCVLEPPPNRISWMQHQQGHCEDPLGPVFGQALLNVLKEGLQQGGAHRAWAQLINDFTLNSTVASVRNFHSISSWAQHRGVPLVWNNSKENPYSSLARDLAHFGCEWHQHTADWFFDQLNG